MSHKGSQNGRPSNPRLSLWEDEISLGNFSGGPPEDSIFSDSGGLWERFGSLPVIPEASRSDFGTIWGTKMEPEGLILNFFEHFGVLFWSLSPVFP